MAESSRLSGTRARSSGVGRDGIRITCDDCTSFFPNSCSLGKFCRLMNMSKATVRRFVRSPECALGVKIGPVVWFSFCALS